MSQFLDALHSGRALLMDGAMGTQLEQAGARSGECYELWNLTEPEKVRAIHQAHVDAGAEVLLTNTFQANPAALARHDLQDRLETIAERAIALARSVTNSHPFVVASIGPVGEADELDSEAFDRVVRAFLGVDALLLETWSDPLALWAVHYGCRCARELADLPILLSLTYRYQRHPSRSLWTLSGHPPEWFAVQAEQNGVAALGVNCGRDIGMDEAIEIIRRYRQVTKLPLFARPNAGTPQREGERWVYPQTPEMMAERLPELLEAGATMVGGCCGTTPEHIAAFRRVLGNPR
jgi:5-methyltetrahydrofolate--homocysteine methyltransferase